MLSLKRLCIPLTILAVGLALVAVGCTGGGAGAPPPPPPPGGFNVGIADQTIASVPIAWHDGGKLTGTWAKDICNPASSCAGSTYAFTAYAGWPNNIVGGRAPAFWQGEAWTYDPCIPPAIFPNGMNWSGNVTAIGSTFIPVTCVTPFASNQFFVSGATPSTWTIQGAGFASTYGMPRLSVLSYAKGLLSQVTASSVASDGSTATFNYPTNSDGSALGAGEYGFIIENKTSSGGYTEAGGNFFSIGAVSTTLAAPYGVDAGNLTNTRFSCNGQTCWQTFQQVTVVPVVTLYNAGQLSVSGNNVAVGSQPVAVKAFNYITRGSGGRGGGASCTWPSQALVANSGSNTVSAISVGTCISSLTVTNTISVGAQPVALLVTSDNSKAYVANLGSGSVSEVSLSSMTQTRTVNVGPSPTSLAFDPSGTSFWVGGLNYISQIDETNFNVIKTYQVSGQVTSLAISSGQSAFVYTIVDGNTFKAQHASLSQGTVLATHYQTTTPPYYGQGQPPGGLPGWTMMGGPLVSAAYSNRYIVEGTPSGFLVYDLQTNTTMLQGSTPSAIRGIAVDPQQGTVYVTSPDSNSLTTIPLPPIQKN